MLSGGFRKACGIFSGDFYHLRRLLQQGKHSLSAGKCLIQIVGQACKSRYRSKGSHHGNSSHQHVCHTHHVSLPQNDHQEKHGKGKDQDRQVRDRTLGGLQAIQAFLHPAQFIRPLCHLFPSLFALPVLDRLIQSPQRVQDKAVQISKTVAEFHPLVRAPASKIQRDHRADHHISRQRKDSRRCGELSDEQDHHKGGQHCNGNRRDGVGIKHFQKLNIRSYDRDQISFVAPFQLRRTQFSKRGEHFMPDDRQKLKCNKMIAVLFPIMQDTAHHCYDSQHDEESPRRCPGKDPCPLRSQCVSQKFLHGLQYNVHQPESRQDSKEDGAQVSDSSQRDGKEHDREKRLHKPDQQSHDTDTAPSCMRLSAEILVCCHTAASFPYCSSFI